MEFRPILRRYAKKRHLPSGNRHQTRLEASPRSNQRRGSLLSSRNVFRSRSTVSRPRKFRLLDYGTADSHQYLQRKYQKTHRCRNR